MDSLGVANAHLPVLGDRESHLGLLAVSLWLADHEESVKARLCTTTKDCRGLWTELGEIIKILGTYGGSCLLIMHVPLVYTGTLVYIII